MLFESSTVSWMLANRGGWGCNRIVNRLNYDLVAAHPKIVMGFSDLTSLLLSIHFATGLVVFHGPMGIDTWMNADGSGTMNSDYVQRVIVSNEMVKFQNPPENKTVELVPGKARGRLIATSHVPSGTIPWEETIVFVEDVDADPEDVDRMLTTMQLSGISERIAGFVFGTCVRCTSSNPSRSFTVDQILQQKKPPCPSFSGFFFGHQGQQFTLPIGVMMEIDAGAGTMTMLETALSD